MDLNERDLSPAKSAALLSAPDRFDGQQKWVPLDKLPVMYERALPLSFSALRWSHTDANVIQQSSDVASGYQTCKRFQHTTIYRWCSVAGTKDASEREGPRKRSEGTDEKSGLYCTNKRTGPRSMLGVAGGERPSIPREGFDFGRGVIQCCNGVERGQDVSTFFFLSFFSELFYVGCAIGSKKTNSWTSHSIF